jgi:hypothetical protein
MIPFGVETLSQQTKSNLWPVLLPASVGAPSVLFHPVGLCGKIRKTHIQTVMDILYLLGEGNAQQNDPLFSVSNTVLSS